MSGMGLEGAQLTRPQPHTHTHAHARAHTLIPQDPPGEAYLPCSFRVASKFITCLWRKGLH